VADLTLRTPLTGHLQPGRHGDAAGTPGLHLAERNPAAAAIARRGDASLPDLPRSPGCALIGTTEFIWTGPGQWLALDPSREGIARFDFARELAERFGSAASVTDLTGARAILRLAGPAVRDTLTKLVPVDLDESMFPPGAAALTLAGHVGVTLWRPTAESWNLACYRSFGASLLHDVLEAAAEFGCDVATG
jgi:heterotetrameric sarcosine oxidase gamma subunit